MLEYGLTELPRATRNGHQGAMLQRAGVSSVEKVPEVGQGP